MIDSKIITGIKISKIKKKQFKKLNVQFVVFHWDSKVLPSLLNTKNVDRLPIIITAGHEEIILGEGGAGLAQATRFLEILSDWGYVIL